MKLHVKSASFSTDNGQTSRFSFSYSISYDKNFTPKYLDNALTYRFCLNFTNIEATVLEKKAPVNDFVRFPNAENYCWSKTGNGVISLLWQLRCHCNANHNKSSSLSNAIAVAIFPSLCLRRRRLCSNLGGIDPEKLYRTTLSGPQTKWSGRGSHLVFHLRDRR